MSKLAFNTNILTGSAIQYIPFAFDFAVIPIVETTMVSISSANFYGVGISGVSTSGFYAIFSDVISDMGLELSTYAVTN